MPMEPHDETTESTVRFTTDKGTLPTTSLPDASEEDLEAKSLCDLINRAHGHQAVLQVIYRGGKLWQTRSRRKSLLSQKREGVTLRSLLAESPKRMKTREQLILAVTLAHAALHCSEGPWLCQDWGKDQVSFFRSDLQEDPDYSHPYLNVSFDDREIGSSDNNNLFRHHDNPYILALGILLLEIRLGKPIESYHEDEDLRDPLYETEKPYSLRFEAPEGFPRANIKLDKRDIVVHDVRDTRLPDFEKEGAALVPFESVISYHEFDDEQVIQKVFLKQVSNFLKTFLKAQHVQIFEHTVGHNDVRKRHETFPISTGEPYRYNQPTSIVHVDTTLEWAYAMAQQLNPGRAESIAQHRLQCVNFWKPIIGPVRDWPLALCSAATINERTDFEPCDLVYPDYVVENRQVYYADRQEWFYVSEQKANEAWIFLQADSEYHTNPIAHTAFPLPGVGPGDVPPRESIEVRALVYYGGFAES
ncbi:hypothetical protein DV736_g2529, partial [Chaetothyriales sp. CBS 134916]